MEQHQHQGRGAIGDVAPSLDSLTVDALLPAIDGLLFLVTRDGRILDFRAGAVSEPFVPADVFLGRTIAEVLPPEVTELLLPQLASVQPGEAPAVAYSLPMDGVMQDYEARLLPLAHDLCVAFVNHVTDAARADQERRAAEEALRDSERRLADATSVGNIGVFEFDIEGNHLYWSREMRAIFGWDPDGTEEISPVDVLLQFHPDERERVARDTMWFRDPASGGLHATHQRILRHDTGEVRWISYRSRTIFEGEGSDARAVRSIGAVQDISDRLALEQLLGQVERLDSIGRLAGGIAHDFNNMLTAVLGFTQLIEEDLRTGSPVALDDLHQISSAAERARDLTAQLLAFARRQPSHPRSIDLNAEIAGGRRLLDQLLRADITVVVDLDPALWPVHIDPAHVEQVLMNLVLNAQDAMPTGGRIVVSTDNVVVDAALTTSLPALTSGPHVRLRVSDEGLGIAAEDLPHVFEPFYTTKSMGGGTGLGLATVHGIARQNGGDIAVRSAAGQGATFDLFLPRAPGTEAEVADVRSETDPTTGDETLLVVEDDDSVRALTARLLEDAGYHVHAAASPAEAIARMRADGGEVDLLVTDIVMPQMSGRALADVLRAMRPGLRVLFVSGYAETGPADDERGEGLEFLAKPFTPSDLRARVRAVLDDPG